MRLILIGPMASGKSTVGRRLSKRLKLDFIDVDEEVEKSAGVSISWIFDVEGEKKFRERESKELKNSLNTDNCVIATGGGAILSEHNRNFIKKCESNDYDFFFTSLVVLNLYKYRISQISMIIKNRTEGVSKMLVQHMIKSVFNMFFLFLKVKLGFIK